MKRIRKHERNRKSQLGQFLTPYQIAKKMVDCMELCPSNTVLEPGCGEGAFVFHLIDKFLKFHEGENIKEALSYILNYNIWAIEIDVGFYKKLQQTIKVRYGYCPEKCNLIYGDFLHHNFNMEFDYAIGNPPFGATIDLKNQDILEDKYGKRNGHKIKKESYSWFVLKALDHLRFKGKYSFICSDSFLTIKTMDGMRRCLMDSGNVSIKSLKYFSEETDYPMVFIDGQKDFPVDKIILNGKPVLKKHMEMTGSFSWTIDKENIGYFDGPKLESYIITTGGLTTGNNEYFIREIQDGKVCEKYSFKYYDDPITLEKEKSKAKLNKLPENKEKLIKDLEAAKATKRNIWITEKKTPKEIVLPHADYKFYNKSTSEIVVPSYKYVIYWKDDGDAVKTYKKNGNWYLHGMGGMTDFGREGLTWNLISDNIKMRYLPAGYIFDNSAPCGFLKDGIDHDELFFIIGWCNTSLATKLMKSYINHTKNIQGKDMEKLPYPFWVSNKNKEKIISLIKSLINENKDLEFKNKIEKWFQRK